MGGASSEPGLSASHQHEDFALVGNPVATDVPVHPGIVESPENISHVQDTPETPSEAEHRRCDGAGARPRQLEQIAIRLIHLIA